MGPDSDNNGTLYLRSEETGEWQPLSDLKIASLSEVAHEVQEHSVPMVTFFHEGTKSCDFTATFTIYGKDFGRMTAKRFKKILLSKGISRDDADFLCYLVGWFKGKVSFHEIYFSTLFLRPAVRFYEVFDYIMTKGEISEWTNIKQQMSLI